ncbi:MAG: DUF167 domain-containing protein [Candidatus Omnitrophica bacterium]|nr:DUF167 domain-containing protein [Candidatus Omnitrophota bacterium]
MTFYNDQKPFQTINIKVIPGARKNRVREESGLLKVYIQAPAVDGKANKALIDYLADYYNVRKSQVTIIKGLKSRLKTISINGV